MTDRYERTTLPPGARVLYRNAKSGTEYIDIEVDLLCPACPEDEDQGVLKMEETRELGIVARCPKCMYRAQVSVYEGG